MSSGHGPGMIKTVLIYTGIAFVIGLIVFWLVSGGIGATARAAQSLTNPIDLIFGGNASGTGIRLPWQPKFITKGPDISAYIDDEEGSYSQEDERARIEAQYGSTIEMPEYDPRTFGNPSPYIGRVVFERHGTSESDPAREYVTLARGSNEGTVALSGWSLQSAVSGVRVSIPYGTPSFMLGVVNSVQAISLEPGASIIVTSGSSPVGTSFRENVCTGYLNELQTFTPELQTQCPSPYGALPITADTIKMYGDECIDYVNDLDECHFPSSVPASLSPACRSIIANTFSYNGCVNTHRNDTSFTLSTWRVYLGSKTELWRNTHDVIRLLDEKGQTVNVLTY